MSPAERPPRATVMGLGLFDGGVGAVRHLVGRGYRVTVTDLRGEDVLRPSVEALADLPVRFRLGGHDPADFEDIDLLVVNPAVPPSSPYLRTATDRGVPVDTEVALFLRSCPADVLGVTGTAGKSTTAALLARCLEGAARRRGGTVHLGGNIGRSLLRDLDALSNRDLVVLELSSFQLHWLRREGLRPGVGVLTNIAPNHLDWHGDLASYVADKTGILPAADGVLVARADDDRVRGLALEAPCRVIWTGEGGPSDGERVAWRGDRLEHAGEGRVTDLLGRSDIRLLGEHASANTASAAAAARAAGALPEEVREAVRGFEGLPHRLCPLGEVRGVLCVDDSKSTTMEAAASALRAFDRPVVLLAGGYDKGAAPAPLVEAAAALARAVVCYGATGSSLAEAIAAAGGRRVRRTETLVEAVEAAFTVLRPGDVLLLSPGHASWDQFENYEHRAREFARAVGLGD